MNSFITHRALDRPVYPHSLSYIYPSKTLQEKSPLPTSSVATAGIVSSAFSRTYPDLVLCAWRLQVLLRAECDLPFLAVQIPLCTHGTSTRSTRRERPLAGTLPDVR